MDIYPPPGFPGRRIFIRGKAEERNMVYLDRAAFEKLFPDGPMGIILNGEQPAWAGTTVYVMPDSCRNEEYERYKREYGISFFFEGGPIPKPDFYAVPWVEIFAIDGSGGWFGTVGGSFDLEEIPVCYITSDHRCFRIAQDGREFIEKAPAWRTFLEPFEELTLYPTKAAAAEFVEFMDLKLLSRDLEQLFKDMGI